MTANDLGPVVITAREIYDQIRAVSSKVDTILAADRTGDHEARLRRLEQWRYALPASMVLAVGSTVTAVLTAVIGQ